MPDTQMPQADVPPMPTTGAGTSVAVVLNPASGPDRDEGEIARIAARLRDDLGASVHVLDDPGALDATLRKVLDTGPDTVVAAGGDGTISAVAEALAGRACAMGVLPLGTFNFLARSLGIDPDIDRAIETLATGVAQPVSLGEINGKVFINNASLGAYATVLQTRERTYRRWGRSRIAAYWSVLVAMLALYRPLHLTVEIDGDWFETRTPMAFLAIRPFQLDQYGLDGAQAVADGAFALYIAPDAGRLSLLWRAVKVLTRGVERGSDYTLHTGREITLTTKRGSELVARDGERGKMPGPFRCRVLPDAVRILVPRDGGGH